MEWQDRSSTGLCRRGAQAAELTKVIFYRAPLRKHCYITYTICSEHLRQATQDGLPCGQVTGQIPGDKLAGSSSRPATEVPFLTGEGGQEGRELEAAWTLKLSDHTWNGMQMACKPEYRGPQKRPSTREK